MAKVHIFTVLFKKLLPILFLIKQFLPDPEEYYGTDYAEYEVCEISLAKQFDVQQMADKSTYIAANDAYDKVHAASFALTTHNAVCNIADENTCNYRPSCKISNML
jgi:hypothetical protein